MDTDLVASRAARSYSESALSLELTQTGQAAYHGYHTPWTSAQSFRLGTVCRFTRKSSSCSEG